MTYYRVVCGVCCVVCGVWCVVWCGGVVWCGVVWCGVCVCVFFFGREGGHPLGTATRNYKNFNLKKNRPPNGTQTHCISVY